MDKETEAPRGCAACRRAHSWREARAGEEVGVRPWAAVPALVWLATSGTGARDWPLDHGSDTQSCGGHGSETLGGPGIRPFSGAAEHPLSLALHGSLWTLHS